MLEEGEEIRGSVFGGTATQKVMRTVFPAQSCNDLVDRSTARFPAGFRGAARAKRARHARQEQLQVIVDLRHRADGRARALDRVRLLDRDRGRDAADFVDPRLVHAVEELPRVGAECFDVTALAFGVNRVEGEARFAAAARAGDDGQFAQRQIEIDAFEIVLARPANLDAILRAWRCDALVLRNLRTHRKYSLPVKRFANSVAASLCEAHRARTARPDASAQRMTTTV